MRYLITTILLALAPLCWGEDVYYCSDELATGIPPLLEGSSFFQTHSYFKERHTIKFDPLYLSVNGFKQVPELGCNPLDVIKSIYCFDAGGPSSGRHTVIFNRETKRYALTVSDFKSGYLTDDREARGDHYIRVGTCTKF